MALAVGRNKHTNGSRMTVTGNGHSSPSSSSSSSFSYSSSQNGFYPIRISPSISQEDLPNLRSSQMRVVPGGKNSSLSSSKISSQKTSPYIPSPIHSYPSSSFHSSPSSSPHPNPRISDLSQKTPSAHPYPEKNESVLVSGDLDTKEIQNPEYFRTSTDDSEEFLPQNKQKKESPHWAEPSNGKNLREDEVSEEDEERARYQIHPEDSKCTDDPSILRSVNVKEISEEMWKDFHKKKSEGKPWKEIYVYYKEKVYVFYSEDLRKFRVQRPRDLEEARLAVLSLLEAFHGKVIDPKKVDLWILHPFKKELMRWSQTEKVQEILLHPGS